MGGSEKTEAGTTDAVGSAREAGHRLVRGVVAAVEESSRRANRVREAIGASTVSYQVLEAGDQGGDTFDSLVGALETAVTRSRAYPAVVYIVGELSGDRLVCLVLGGAVLDVRGEPTTSSAVMRLEHDRPGARRCTR